MNLLNVKDIPLMSSDQSFSNVIDESGFVVVEKRVEVPKVSIPTEPKQQHSEPLKFDL